MITPNATNHTTPGADDFDKEGAMTFIVAVILVYGLAVMGVIALGLLKKKRVWHVDREAIEFVKHIEEVRRSIDQQRRVGAISSLLKSLHNGGGVANGNASETVQKNLLGKFEMFALPMSPTREGANDTDENNNVKNERLTMNAKIVENGHNVTETESGTSPDIDIVPNGDVRGNIHAVHVHGNRHVVSRVNSSCTETEV